jgi:hypothetical protein
MGKSASVRAAMALASSALVSAARRASIATASSLRKSWPFP